MRTAHILVASFILVVACGACGQSCPRGSALDTQLDKCIKIPQTMQVAGASGATGEAESSVQTERGSRAADAGGSEPGQSRAGSSSQGVSMNAAAPSAMNPGGTATSGAQAASQAGNGAAAPSASDDADAPSMPSGPCAGKGDEFVCEESVLHHCDGMGNSTAETCMSPAACQIGMSAQQCAACSPGSYQCDGAQLNVCGDTGQFAAEQTCASAELCNENAGACIDMECVPNEKTCSPSGTLQTCNADGSQFASMDDCGMGLCDASAKRCNACVPSSKTCEGSAAVVCSADGQNTTMMDCEPRGECWTATCRGGACEESPKLAVSSNRCEGDKFCDGLGNCVGCITDRNCADDEMCDLIGRTCVKKPCGDGTIGAGEQCDPNHSGWNRSNGLCNDSCQIDSAIYARSCGNPQSAVWTGSLDVGWMCNGVGVASRGCLSDADCRTSGGRGECLDYGPNKDFHFCGVRCTTPGTQDGCPNGSCRAVPDGTPTCGTREAQP